MRDLVSIRQKKAKIPSLTDPSDWQGEAFNEFKKQVDQARIIIFTIIPTVDCSDSPDTLIMTSLWGEILVSRIKEMAEMPEGRREEVEGHKELRMFFQQPETAYIGERGWISR